ncbi:MAG: hypothetical protein RSB38_09170 [Oscillospiraceae bacterium]
MVTILSQFFSILGVDLQPPTTFANFTPWLLQVFLGIAVVAFVFKFFFSVARGIMTGRGF